MFQAQLVGAAALAVTVVSSSFAPSLVVAEATPSKPRSLARCTSFEQREKDETSLEITIKNRCSMPIDCKLSWQLVCAPESKKRRKVLPESTAFTLSTDAAQSTSASATVCGDDSWVIQSVTWRCEASKE